MTDTTVRITHVRPAGTPYKTNKPYATSWYIPIEYTLEDGRLLPATYGFCSRRKDVIEGAVERDVYNMMANFEGERFIGTTTTYRVGG